MLPAMACLMSSSLGPIGSLSSASRAHDLAAGAIAALVAVVLHKGRLHGVQIVRLSQAFDGRDLVALVHYGERKTAVHAPPVDVHGACAALAMVAALLGAGQVQAFAQRVEQGGARIGIGQLVLFAIHPQG